MPTCCRIAELGRPSKTILVISSSRSRATAFVRAIRRDPDKSGQVSKCQKGSRPAIHRLANLDGMPERHREIQDQRPTTLSSGRKRPGWLRVVFTLPIRLQTLVRYSGAHQTSAAWIGCSYPQRTLGSKRAGLVRVLLYGF